MSIRSCLRTTETTKSINSKNVTQLMKPEIDIISDYKDLDGVPNVNIPQSARPVAKRDSQKMGVALSNRGSHRPPSKKDKVVNQISLQDSNDDIKNIQIEKPPTGK